MRRLTRGIVASAARSNAGEPRFPAQNFPQSNAIRDVCHVTIYSDARGLGPNRNDGRDLPAPYAISRRHRRPRIGAAIDLPQCGMDKIAV
jgi:hypothetical protein